MKQRLDVLLVDRNLCLSRQQAQLMIRAGEVKVNDRIIDKPGTEISVTAEIIVAQKPPFVSRGGEKLAKALQEFPISIQDRICLDGGISTGGFTDCLLKSGAKLVYGIDVGYGQTAWEIRQDQRVILKERTNFRHLTPQILYGEALENIPTLGVMDVSFISLTKLLESLWNLLTTPKEIILLVKPQFEVGREKVGKKGIVRNPQYQAEAIEQVIVHGRRLGWNYQGLIPSPITGTTGNVEYLLWMSCENSPHQPPNLAELEIITEISFQALTKSP